MFYYETSIISSYNGRLPNLSAVFKLLWTFANFYMKFKLLGRARAHFHKKGKLSGGACPFYTGISKLRWASVRICFFALWNATHMLLRPAECRSCLSKRFSQSPPRVKGSCGNFAIARTVVGEMVLYAYNGACRISPRARTAA